MVFPRRAGVDRRKTGATCSVEGFPPACGGGPLNAFPRSPRLRFSPGVRGWTDEVGRRDGEPVVFPRRAGVDRKQKAADRSC